MTKKTVECAGLFDVVEQVRRIINNGGEIELDSIGGTGGDNFFYYFDAYDKEENLESFELHGRANLISKISEIFSSGGTIDMPTLGASGGRTNWYWFDSIGEEEKPLTDAVVPSETPPQEESEEDTTPEPEETSEVEVEASPAAVEFAKIHNIDLSKVTGSGKAGKITKPDIVKYFDNQK